MVKAIIYDLDDLMVQSHLIHVKAWELELKKFGKSFSDLPKEDIGKYLGMRVIDITKIIKKDLQLKTPIDQLYKERNEIFQTLIKKELKTTPGLRYSLKLFKDKFKIALASSGTKVYINLVLEKFKIRDYFDVLVTGDDVKAGKPDPQTYLKACQKLDLKPDECLVLEDATKGIESAKRAGCFCFGVENKNTPSQDRSNADKIIPSLNALTLDMIKEL